MKISSTIDKIGNSGVTTGLADPAKGGTALRGRQNRSKIWDIFCKLKQSTSKNLRLR